MPFLPRILPRQDEHRQAEAYNAVLRFEAKIGGKLFGPIPEGHRREFFCLDKHTWVWHEEWTDEDGRRQVLTTNYHVRPDGVLKTQGSRGYQQLTREELYNLYHAAKLYGEVVPQALRHLIDDDN